MALPNFLCVGAQKAGTTTLYEILKQHPDIFLPQNVKETKFFVYPDKYENGLEYYEKEYFSEWQGQQAIGEVDPAIMFEEQAASRIHRSLGNKVKLIFILRNPAARAYSHFLMTQRKGFEELSFDEAISKEKDRLVQNPAQKFNFSYLTRGYYSRQIERFKEYFPAENFLFLIFEDDFIKNRKITFDRIQDFLEVKRVGLDLDIRSNKAAAPKNKTVHELMRKRNAVRNTLSKIMPGSLKKTIQDFISKKNIKEIEHSTLDVKKEMELIQKFFMEDIQKLEKILYRDLSTWYTK
ncbi:MAG: sulfotransferase domain-containing protein [Chitinophagales bacterium]|nr:sulfotransferase domain-containing protein [Chitinophagales bacterium]